MFGGFSDIIAARAVDPNFNLASWFKRYGINEVLSGSRKIPGFKNGGIVGNGLWNTDSVIAAYAGGGQIALAGGEFVMPAPQTAQYASELNAMRSGTYSSGSDDAAVVTELKALVRIQSAANQKLIEEMSAMREEMAQLTAKVRLEGSK